jgi:hypothetical protein
MLAGCAAIGSNKESGEKRIQLTAKNLENIAGKKEIYIGQFSVTFVTQDKASATSESALFSSDSGYATSILKSELKGVPPQTMQSITDRAYADLRAKLSAQGFTVREQRELTARGDWKKIKTLSTPYSPSAVGGFLKGDSGKSLTLAPTGLNLFYYLVPQQQDPTSVSSVPYALAEFAGSLGSPVVVANYRIHFANLSGETDRTMDYNTDNTTYSAEMTLGQAITVMPGSGIGFIQGLTSTFSNPNSYVTLKTPVIIGGAYGQNEDTTSGAQKAANLFSSALGVISGGATNATSITVTADPALYEQGVFAAIDLANEKIVARAGSGT